MIRPTSCPNRRMLRGGLLGSRRLCDRVFSVCARGKQRHRDWSSSGRTSVTRLQASVQVMHLHAGACGFCGGFVVSVIAFIFSILTVSDNSVSCVYLVEESRGSLSMNIIHSLSCPPFSSFSLPLTSLPVHYRRFVSITIVYMLLLGSKYSPSV